MERAIPICPQCRRELAAFVPRRRWICVYCGIDEPFAPPERGPSAQALPSRGPLGVEQDARFRSWQDQHFTAGERLALIRLKLDRERLILEECGEPGRGVLGEPERG